MFWVRKKKRLIETFLLRSKKICLVEKNDKNQFWGLYIIMSTSLLIELLIILNKISSPEDFEFEVLLYNYLFPSLSSSDNSFAKSLDPDQDHRMSIQMWIQTVQHSDSIPESIFEKSQQMYENKSMKKYPACEELIISLQIKSIISHCIYTIVTKSCHIYVSKIY